MPICPFFVSGKCTYGSRCYNLHVDVGQAVMATAKASIVGKQWPLSCFAPLEGEVDLPNYIEDEAFEEVRSEFYAARGTNSEILAKQKFNQSCAQAMELTMKMINQDPTVLAYLVETYGVNGKRKNATNNTTTTTTQANPFSQAAATSPAAGGSIFGGSANTTSSPFGAPAAHATGGSIFGGGAGNPVPVNNPSGSIFGASAATGGGGGGSIFGGTANTPTSGGSIFGGGGGGQQQQQTNTGIFGGGGQQQAIAVAPAQGANIFSQSVFGQTQQQQPVASSGNIFGQTQVQQQPQGNIFQQAQMEQPSIFGQQQQQPVNLTQQAPPPNPFQNASPFSQQQVPESTQPSTGNVFGNLGLQANQAAQSAIFGGAPAAVVPSGNVFGASPFGGGGQQEQQQKLGGGAVEGEDVYSKIEDLQADVLEMYQGNVPFELGKIPNMPPPRELCF